MTLQSPNLSAMSIGILGTKLGMSQFFNPDGKAVPVTLIQAGPCRVTQRKSMARDGYSAVQIGYGEVREKLVSQPAKGHLAKKRRHAAPASS